MSIIAEVEESFASPRDAIEEKKKLTKELLAYLKSEKAKTLDKAEQKRGWMLIGYAALVYYENDDSKVNLAQNRLPPLEKAFELLKCLSERDTLLVKLVIYFDVSLFDNIQFYVPLLEKIKNGQTLKAIIENSSDSMRQSLFKDAVIQGFITQRLKDKQTSIEEKKVLLELFNYLEPGASLTFYMTAFIQLHIYKIHDPDLAVMYLNICPAAFKQMLSCDHPLLRSQEFLRKVGQLPRVFRKYPREILARMKLDTDSMKNIVAFLKNFESTSSPSQQQIQGVFSYGKLLFECQQHYQGIVFIEAAAAAGNLGAQEYLAYINREDIDQIVDINLLAALLLIALHRQADGKYLDKLLDRLLVIFNSTSQRDLDTDLIVKLCIRKLMYEQNTTLPSGWDEKWRIFLEKFIDRDDDIKVLTKFITEDSLKLEDIIQIKELHYSHRVDLNFIQLLALNKFAISLQSQPEEYLNPPLQQWALQLIVSILRSKTITDKFKIAAKDLFLSIPSNDMDMLFQQARLANEEKGDLLVAKMRKIDEEGFRDRIRSLQQEFKERIEYQPKGYLTGRRAHTVFYSSSRVDPKAKYFVPAFARVATQKLLAKWSLLTGSGETNTAFRHTHTLAML